MSNPFGISTTFNPEFRLAWNPNAGIQRARGEFPAPITSVASVCVDYRRNLELRFMNIFLSEWSRFH